MAAASCSGGGGGDGGAGFASGRSVTAFCDTLDAGIAQLRGNTTAAGSSTGDQLLLLVSNLSATNTLIGKLDDVAPEEIATEMSIAADAWSKQMDAAGDAASDPFGAFGTVLVSALMSSDAIGKVDEWSRTNCGQPVFGAGATTSVGSRPCAWASDATATAVFPKALAPDATYQTLSAVLERIEKNVPSPGSDAAAALLSKTRSLAPAPRYGLEALGRLAWGGVDAEPLVASIDKAVADVCDTPAFDPDERAAVGTLGPELVNDQRAESTKTLFGRCSDPTLAKTFSLLYHCGDDLALIDLSTGAVEHFEGLGKATAFPESNKPRFRRMVPTGVFWISWKEEPASGLTPARYVTMLNSLDYATKEQRTIEVHSRTSPHADNPVDIVGVSYDRVVLRQEASFDVYDLALNQVASLPIHRPMTYDTPSQVTLNTLLMGQPDTPLLINIAAGTAQPVPGAQYVHARLQSRTACMDRAAIEARDGYQIIYDDQSGVRWGPVAAEMPGLLVAPEGIVRMRYSSEAIGIDLSGAQTWSLQQGVVSDIEVFGGWIVVKNPSDEIFVLNPLTGDIVNNDTPGFAEGVKAVMTKDSISRNPSIEWTYVDWHTGLATLATDDAVWQLPAATFCPRDYTGG